RGIRRLSVLTITFVAIVVALPTTAKGSTSGTPADGQIVATSTMGMQRSGHTATLLRDGNVLIAGGMVRNGEFVAEAELYDPSTGKFSPAGRMASPRVGHTATQLPDGKVLIAGGYDRPNRDVAQAEIYDPATKKFAATGSLVTSRSDAQAVLLPN